MPVASRRDGPMSLEFCRNTVRQRDKNRHIKKREIQRENCNYGQTAVGPSMKGSPCDSLRFKMLSHKGLIGTEISGAAPVSCIFFNSIPFATVAVQMPGCTTRRKQSSEQLRSITSA